MPSWVVVPCMSSKPHSPHTWREGFLWLTKKECGGYFYPDLLTLNPPNAALVPATKEQRRKEEYEKAAKIVDEYTQRKEREERESFDRALREGK